MGFAGTRWDVRHLCGRPQRLVWGAAMAVLFWQVDAHGMVPSFLSRTSINLDRCFSRAVSGGMSLWGRGLLVIQLFRLERGRFVRPPDAGGDIGRVGTGG